MEEGVEVVGLIFDKDIHGNIPSRSGSISIQNLVGRIVVGVIRNDKSSQATRCDEDGTIRHSLS
jgi:hypothetical protein